MINFGRRKSFLFFAFSSLLFFVVVVNRMLSSGLSGEAVEVDTDGAKPADARPVPLTTSRETTRPTTSPSASPARKVGFLKPQTVASITTQPSLRTNPDSLRSNAEDVRTNPDDFRSKSDVRRVSEDGYRRSPISGARYIPTERVVHLDLKGAPPKVSYLRNIFPLLKEAGATSILIEYEDMFPFWGPLRNISAGNAYTASDVQAIQNLAAQNDLAVIPLIQTFGHMEFVLKLDEFKHLREVPIYPESICPSNEEGWKLIQQMIDQGKAFSSLDKYVS
jgi:hypothetical protein